MERTTYYALRNTQPAIHITQYAVRILGVRVDALTYDDLLEQIAGFIAEGAPHQICTVNPEFVMEARRNPAFRAVLEQADLCLADGVGLLWAARRQGRRLPERVTGSDGVPLIAARAAEAGWRLYLLGAAPGVAEQAAEILTGRYPGLQVVGAYVGSPTDADAPEIIARVRQAKPDVLFVAYGAPSQDLWIARRRDTLGVPVMMGVGGAFDHITGMRRRAPAWVQRLNLEWLFRLITQPWRWRRQLALPWFVWAVMREKEVAGIGY
ncbi:MAG: acetylglucosaminyldiphospho-UDP acetyl-beta-D-mannosaminyltransferase [Chloroflexi bacterium HGW-Chloroflexi-1]|nr:MAG: acetylglucosaminyldiphospho-UDP acetyl-beta-D-mannosaminyltransferase [Chloroflexi bacterium HGW-Chloroflexi-1]